MESKNTTAYSPTAKRHFTKELAVIEVQGKAFKIPCYLSNLSMSGAFFQISGADQLPKQGDLVRATINLKDLKKNYVIYGRVVWSRLNGLGVEFIKGKKKK